MGGDKEEEEPTVVEEVAHNKETVSTPIETQGIIPIATSPENQSLDSNEGVIKKYMVASAANRKRKEIEEEEEVKPLIRKKQMVSQGLEQLVEPSKDATKDKKPKNADAANNLESAVATTSFDRIAAKLAKKKVKVRKELKPLRKKAKKVAKAIAASNKESLKETQAHSNAETYLPPDP